jgi:hypothetical protein
MQCNVVQARLQLEMPQRRPKECKALDIISFVDGRAGLRYSGARRSAADQRGSQPGFADVGEEIRKAGSRRNIQTSQPRMYERHMRGVLDNVRETAVGCLGKLYNQAAGVPSSGYIEGCAHPPTWIVVDRKVYRRMDFFVNPPRWSKVSVDFSMSSSVISSGVDAEIKGWNSFR